MTLEPAIIIHGKRNFADVIKLMVLGWGGYQDYPGGSNVIARVPIRGRQEGQSKSRQTDDRGRDGVMQEPHAGNVGGL